VIIRSGEDWRQLMDALAGWREYRKISILSIAKKTGMTWKHVQLLERFEAVGPRNALEHLSEYCEAIGVQLEVTPEARRDEKKPRPDADDDGRGGLGEVDLLPPPRWRGDSEGEQGDLDGVQRDPSRPAPLRARRHKRSMLGSRPR